MKSNSRRRTLAKHLSREFAKQVIILEIFDIVVYIVCVLQVPQDQDEEDHDSHDAIEVKRTRGMELMVMSFMPRLILTQNPFQMIFPIWMSTEARDMLMSCIETCRSLPQSYKGMRVLADASLKEWPLPKAGTARGRVPTAWMVKESLADAYSY